MQIGYVGTSIPDDHIWMSDGPQFWIGPYPTKRILRVNEDTLRPLHWRSDKDLVFIHRPDDEVAMGYAATTYLDALNRAMAEESAEHQRGIASQ